MSKSRRDTRDSRCPNCRINTHWCFCDVLKPFANQTKVIIPMHFTERWLTSNTAYFATKVLKSCEIMERGNFEAPFDVDSFDFETFDYIYLFPTEDSLPLNEYRSSDKTPCLVVPDGSWSKAKKFHKREEVLAKMPKYHLIDVGHSIYELRKSPGENFLCTYEAIAHALAVLDGEPVKHHMIDIFKVIVERIKKSRKGDFRL
ncbi:tRNA-uridine aminocarboxypropyltransferase [Halobacteriovorax sp. HFRX-2_2]|uniref:tRNA-uridine aminocarboxypropyltransferase n=1 Tax=unclassified Halobacteriovorax TaxID=2639665 RepID=UPI0037236EA8